jgi:UPF0755 protein
MVLASVVCCAAVVGWLHLPLRMQQSVVDVSIAPGDSARKVAQRIQDAGVDAPAAWLYWTFRLSGEARLIKAGSYELEKSLTPLLLLRKLVEGDQALRRVTLVEGWSFKQVRQALQQADHLQPLTAAMTDAEVMQALGRPGVLPDGRFFPDTYIYPKGSDDLAVLRQAMSAMDEKMAQVWARRNPATPLTSPEQMLILASIVEKETGLRSDQAMIAGVFSNRLRIGMRLQTDPTVIYGLGTEFDGNLRRIHLQTDTPYNTYTRPGLPPGPIALPGEAALLAAVQPATTDALYFVARGDGTSQFSASLDEHNRAVNRYQR